MADVFRHKILGRSLRVRVPSVPNVAFADIRFCSPKYVTRLEEIVSGVFMEVELPAFGAGAIPPAFRTFVAVVAKQGCVWEGEEVKSGNDTICRLRGLRRRGTLLFEESVNELHLAVLALPPGVEIIQDTNQKGHLGTH